VSYGETPRRSFCPAKCIFADEMTAFDAILSGKSGQQVRPDFRSLNKERAKIGPFRGNQGVR
jgi:hypothetical protein